MILSLPFCLVGEKVEEKRRKIDGTFGSDKIDKEKNRKMLEIDITILHTYGYILLLLL